MTDRVYRLDEAAAILSRTPGILRAWLSGLPDAWTTATEGPGTWSAFDVVGHLIHGERTDWLPRAEHLLEHGESLAFPVFDRTAMFDASKGKSLAQLLDTFDALRSANLALLRSKALTEADLDRRGRHPEFGPVTLRQHLATWVAHDLSHLAQIARVMAKRYEKEVGPWTAYLSILSR
ncbi:MAG TPA: DinB family protein [Candidatus Eisenbacteria bacterium]|nr:DinB family protein [Candidatus Eisenbacteria bacterium]